MKHIGFTGSRHGMTVAQRERLVAFLERAVSAGPVVFHHGDCQGADSQAHSYALAAGCLVYLHPPDTGILRAGCQGASVVAQPRPYLARNRDIVDACDLLLAAPDGPEALRSGTWATVRYARTKGKDLVVLKPDAGVNRLTGAAGEGTVTP